MLCCEINSTWRAQALQLANKSGWSDGVRVLSFPSLALLPVRSNRLPIIRSSPPIKTMSFQNFDSLAGVGLDFTDEVEIATEAAPARRFTVYGGAAPPPPPPPAHLHLLYEMQPDRSSMATAERVNGSEIMASHLSLGRDTTTGFIGSAPPSLPFSQALHSNPHVISSRGFDRGMGDAITFQSGIARMNDDIGVGMDGMNSVSERNYSQPNGELVIPASPQMHQQ